MIPDLYDRKLGVGEIYSKGWQIYCRYFSCLVAFVLPCEFVAQMLEFAVSQKTLHTLISLSTWLITLIGTIVVIFVASKSASTLPVSWEDCRKKILEAYGRTVWAKIVLSVILALSILPVFFVRFGMFIDEFLAGASPFSGLLFALPFVIVFNYLGFVICAVVLRGYSAVPALGYSWRLVRGRWWYVLGMTFLLYLPVIIIRIVGITAGRVFASYVNWGFVMGFTVFLMPLFQIYSTILFTLFFLNIDRNVETPSSSSSEYEEHNEI
jgi:hypothetical protein